MKVVEKKLGDETPGKTEGDRRATGVFSDEEAAAHPPVAAVADTGVVATAQRRRFTAAYKQQIVREADRCTEAGEIGALLRREGGFVKTAAALAGQWHALRTLGWHQARN